MPCVSTNTPVTISSDVSCRDAIALLKEEGFDMVPVVEEDKIVGVVTEGNMTNSILTGRANPDQTVKVNSTSFSSLFLPNLRSLTHSLFFFLLLDKHNN